MNDGNSNHDRKNYSQSIRIEQSSDRHKIREEERTFKNGHRHGETKDQRSRHKSSYTK